MEVGWVFSIYTTEWGGKGYDLGVIWVHLFPCFLVYFPIRRRSRTETGPCIVVSPPTPTCSSL